MRRLYIHLGGALAESYPSLKHTWLAK